MKRRPRCFLAIILACVCGYLSFAEPPDFGRHRGAVKYLLRDEQGNFLSAGEDGFIGIWSEQEALDRFQVSGFSLGSMVLRPGKHQLAFIEDDGLGIHRVSLWNYATRENIFTFNFMDTVSYINFSAAGNFLIVSLIGKTGVTFIEIETEKTFEPLEDLTDNINFAATSLSERIMICYSPAGILSYWDLETGIELHRYYAAPNIKSPVLFGNNCYIGGSDSGALVIIDALTGATIAKDDKIRGNIFIDESETHDPQGRTHFYCLSSTGSSNTIIRLQINTSGALSVTGRFILPPAINGISSAVSAGAGNFILGSENGSLWLWSAGRISLLDSGSPEPITDIAASSDALGFITGSGKAAFLPLNFSILKNGEELILEDISVQDGLNSYTRVSSGPSAAGNSAFVFWQPNRTVPMLMILHGSPQKAAGDRIFLEKLPLRYPLRSAALMGSSLLFLNTQGAISLLNRESGNLQYSYTASGAQDAAFIDANTIIIGRSAVTGTTPFLIINSITGETVPLPYPAMLGLKVYRGGSGEVYGAVVNQNAGEIKTLVLRLNSANPSQSEKLIEYDGEDSAFFMIESGGNPVHNLGSGEASIYRSPRTGSRNQGREKITVERSRGLPQKAVDGNGRLIILDGDGSLCWHDSATGKLLATFSLYRDYWTLKTGASALRGNVSAR